MKKLKVGLILVGMLCTFYGYAQEEFFGKNAGLNLSAGSSTFFTNDLNVGLSYYSKKSWISSVKYSLDFERNPITCSFGYLKDITKSNKTVDTKLVMGVSCMLQNIYIPLFVGPDLGISFTFYPKGNFPFFFGCAAFAYAGLRDFNKTQVYSGLTLNYTQAFFAKNNVVYPFISISKSFNFLYQSSDNLYFRAGLNIKL